MRSESGNTAKRGVIGRRATSTDVAKLAGVSRTTVSEIFNGREARFPADTRERVLAAAAQLRYSPSQAARTLKIGRSDTVLLVIPNPAASGEFRGLVEGISSILTPLGLHLAIQLAPHHSFGLLDEILRLLPAGVIDLGVLGADTQDMLRASGVIVVPDAREPGNTGFQEQIGHLLMETLLRHPGRRYYYAGSTDLASTRYDQFRLMGMRQVADARASEQPSQIDIRLDADEAARVLKPLVSGGAIGVACYTDTVAMAVIAAARRLALRVPEDVAVVGVDGSFEGQLSAPRLTSVEIDARQVGVTVAETFAEAFTGVPHTREFHADLAVRVISGETA